MIALASVAAVAGVSFGHPGGMKYRARNNLTGKVRAIVSVPESRFCSPLAHKLLLSIGVK